MWFYLRPDAISVWEDDEVKRRLEWYYSVMVNSKPAKFMIAKRVYVEENPYEINDLAELWKIHDRLSKDFDKILNKIKIGSISIRELDKPNYSFLDVKIAIAWKIIEKCHFCERRCNVNRVKGEKGFCRLNSKVVVHSWFHHYGEEAPLVPSGTIFYGSCNFRCVYCIDENEYLLARISDMITVEKIKNIVKYFVNGVKVEVLTLKGWRKVKNIIGRISHVIYEIVTNRGMRVKLTPEHIIIVRDNSNNLKEIPTENLRIGDKLVTLQDICNSKLKLDNIIINFTENINLIEELDKSLNPKLKEKIRVKNASKIIRELCRKYNISYKELMSKAYVENFKYSWINSDSYPLQEFIKVYRRFKELRENISQYTISLGKGVKYYIPALIRITPNLMRFLGYFTAGGNYKGDYALVIPIPCEKVRKDITYCIRELLRGANVDKVIHYYKGYKGKIPKIIIKNKLLYILLKYIFCIEDEEHNRGLPWIVYSVRRDLVREFLTAFLTYNGILKSKGGRGKIQIIVNSEKLVYSLVYLLGLHGIQCRIKENIVRNDYTRLDRSRSKYYLIEADVHGSTRELVDVSQLINSSVRSNTYYPSLFSEEIEEVLVDDIVVKIKVVNSRRKVYDIVLDTHSDSLEEHVFFVGSGILVHNCQNYDISQVYPTDGVIVDAKSLALIQKKLREEGVRNINHVGGDPTPNIHVILESMKYLDINVPQLWNSNMYCSIEAMKLLREVIDIWLPDFKYGNNKCAERLSMVPNYFEVVSRNIKLAHEWSDIIIRHLVLPNHIECCTRPILEWIAKNTPRALVNIMDQYRPEYLVVQYPERYKEITRRLKRGEILKAYSIADELGIVYKQIS